MIQYTWYTIWLSILGILFGWIEKNINYGRIPQLFIKIFSAKLILSLSIKFEDSKVTNHIYTVIETKHHVLWAPQKLLLASISRNSLPHESEQGNTSPGSCLPNLPHNSSLQNSTPQKQQSNSNNTELYNNYPIIDIDLRFELS